MTWAEEPFFQFRFFFSRRRGGSYHLFLRKKSKYLCCKQANTYSYHLIAFHKYFLVVGGNVSELEVESKQNN